MPGWRLQTRPCDILYICGAFIVWSCIYILKYRNPQEASWQFADQFFLFGHVNGCHNCHTWHWDIVTCSMKYVGEDRRKGRRGCLTRNLRQSKECKKTRSGKPDNATSVCDLFWSWLGEVLLTSCLLTFIQPPLKGSSCNKTKQNSGLHEGSLKKRISER